MTVDDDTVPLWHGGGGSRSTCGRRMLFGWSRGNRRSFVGRVVESEERRRRTAIGPLRTNAFAHFEVGLVERWQYRK
jgi:hypothetical protein